MAFQAVSLSRRVLDEALLDKAVEAGAEVRRGVRATTLERNGTGWVAGVDTGETLGARHLFLATGKHDLRGWKHPPGPQSDLLGFKTYLNPKNPERRDGTVELHLFPGG